jgi:hypothetical protein
MPLELKRRKGSKHWYIRGTVRGQPIFETTGTHDKKAAEAIRIKREARLLDDSIHGKKASVTFAEAAVSYLTSGGSRRYLGEQRKDGSWSGLIGYSIASRCWPLASLNWTTLQGSFTQQQRPRHVTDNATRLSLRSGIMQ